MPRRRLKRSRMSKIHNYQRSKRCPDDDDDNIYERNNAFYNTQPLRSNALSSPRPTSQPEGSRIATQAAKAIEAAEDLERAAPPERTPRMRPPDSQMRSAMTAEVNEHTPLLDAGPAQPPPDYAAATAWRRTQSLNGNASAQATMLHPTTVLPQVAPNEHRLPEAQVSPPPTSSSRGEPDLESARLKGYKRRQVAWRVLDRAIYLFLKLVFLISVLLFLAGKLFGEGTVAVVRRCVWVSFAVFLGAAIAGLVLFYLKGRGVI